VTKVLVVQKFAPPGSPQDQQRGAMYEPLFRAAGIDVRYVARYPMWAMGRSQSLVRPPDQLSAGFRSTASTRMRRAFDALGDRRVIHEARGADVIHLIKTDSPSLIRELRRATGARLVYDLADTRRRDDRESAELDEMIGAVDAITVDNAFALEYARSFGKPVHIVPPVAYVERFDAIRAVSRRGRDGRIVIGWIGTRSTAANLYLVFESLEDVFGDRPDCELRLVGVPAAHDVFGRFEHVRATTLPEYDADAMVREVLAMDVGLFPQYDLEQAAMHGVTKALIYMGGGAAVLASPLPEVAKLVRDGGNGMLASGRAEWTAKLRALVDDAALRQRLADAGLHTVREEHSLASCFARLREALAI
jgi:glycosyltransferase involved in cell wall biosynthesis